MTRKTWRAWLLLAVACWACVAPTVAVTFAPNFALSGPETRNSGSFATCGDSRVAAPPQVADPHQGETRCAHETASRVHNYLYAHADPVRFSDPSGHLAGFDLTSLQATTFVVGNVSRMAIPNVARYVVAVVAGTALALTSGDSRVSVEEMRRRGKAIIGETANRVRAAKAMRYQDAEIFDWDDSTDNLITEVGELSGAGRLRVLEELNYAWIASVMARRLIIYDIGFDVDRSDVGIFYMAELEWTRGYPLKVFVQFPGSKHLLGP